MRNSRLVLLLPFLFALLSGCSTDPTDTLEILETGLSIDTPLIETTSPQDTVESLQTQVIVLPLVESGASQGQSVDSTRTPPGEVGEGGEMQETVKTNLADIVSVDVSGNERAYQFSVGIRSPDTGCDQYADWWEVITGDGDLIYRRILLHSHVNEQPFVRSGGPVTIDQDTLVIVRAHMNTDGYGGIAFEGSVQSGFKAVDLDPSFAFHLSETQPLPEDCAF